MWASVDMCHDSIVWHEVLKSIQKDKKLFVMQIAHEVHPPREAHNPPLNQPQPFHEPTSTQSHPIHEAHPPHEAYPTEKHHLPRLSEKWSPWKMILDTANTSQITNWMYITS